MIYIQDGNKQERDKYHEIWSTIPEYKNYSPGLESVEWFMKVVKPDFGKTIIDLGCGSCVAGMKFEEHGLRAWYLDITDAAKPDGINVHKFILSPLWGDWRYPFNNHKFDYGYCCDVMEHIPTEYVMLCLDRVIKNCDISWFRIALVEDEFGKTIGQPLHLTVRPFDWWLIRLATLGKVVDARDLLDNGLFVVTK